MSIHKKLVLIFIAFSCTLIVSMALLMKWSFQRNFSDYVQEQNQARLREAAQRLGDYYRQAGSWDEVRNNPRLLRRFVGRSLPDLPPSDRGMPHDAEPPPPQHRPSLRSLYLLDADQKTIAGKAPAVIKLAETSPVTVDGITVGYTGFNVGPRPFNMADERFAERQAKNLLLASATAIILSLLFAWPLARFLVQRLASLGQQIRHLSEGRFEERIAIGGKDELSQLANHLNHLALTLQQTEHSRRKWVADISHELRTPLATLRAQLEAIEDGVHQYNEATHQRLSNQTLRLQQLVEDLYQLSLADVGALQYRKQPCDIRQLLDECTQSFRERFQRAGITLHSDVALPGNIELFADPQRIQQLLGNLLENSLRYTHAPGETRITTWRKQDKLMISVEDTAPGVAEAQLEKLFDRFYRGESSRNRDSGGAGLGLNLCRSIVEAHGGSIMANNGKLGGLEIIITLPITTLPLSKT